MDPLELVQEMRCGEEVSCLDVRGGRVALGAGGAVAAWEWGGGGGQWIEEGRVGGAHRYGVTAVRWGGGGALLASGGVDGAVRLWGRRLGARGLLGAPGAAAVRGLAWASSGIRLVSGHDDGAARLWLAGKGLLLAELQPGGGALYAVAAPGDLLLAACTEGVLRIWPLQQLAAQLGAGRPPPPPVLWEDGAHDMGALCAATSPDGLLAATGGHDDIIRLWTLSTPAAAGRLTGHGAAVTALSWATGLLASGSLDRTARLWAVDPEGKAGRCLLVLPAHGRYLTAVALDPAARVLLTASNDHSVRTWAIPPFEPSDPLIPACNLLQHSAVGDLQGMDPVEEDLVKGELDYTKVGIGKTGADSGDTKGAKLAASAHHGGAVNGIACDGDMLVTASSDGCVRVFRWDGQRLELERTIEGDGYPLLAIAAEGGVIAAGGMGGGCRILVGKTGGEAGENVDTSGETEDTVRENVDTTEENVEAAEKSSARVGEIVGHVGGVGGVRGVSLSPHRPPLLLLGTDEGAVDIYTTDGFATQPEHSYEGHVGAALCVSWHSPTLLASGGEGGDLQLHRPPPDASTLTSRADAHEVGVLCMEFASSEALEAAGAGDRALLATAGCDGLVKLWLVNRVHSEGESSVSLRLARVLTVAGGGMSALRWGVAGGSGGSGGALLGGGGCERWARVWGVTTRGGVLSVRHVAAAPVRHAGGAVSVLPLDGGFLALGTMGGELTIWELPALGEGEEIEGEEWERENDELSETQRREEWSLEEMWDGEPRWWGVRGVCKWLGEHVEAKSKARAALQRAAWREGVTGPRLLDEPMDRIVDLLLEGIAEDELADDETLAAVTANKSEDTPSPLDDGSADDVHAENPSVRSRLVEELRWLRAPPPPPELASLAPHRLLCPLSHRLLRWPVRAPDGLTYEREALREWFLAAGGSISWLTGRTMRAPLTTFDRVTLLSLRAFLSQNGASPPLAPPTP